MNYPLMLALLGNLAATTPLAYGASTIGWRVVFALVVGFTFLMTIAVWLVVRDAPPGHPFLSRKTETAAEMLLGLREVLRNPSLPYIVALNFCNYACSFTVQGLWGGPYLREAHGLTQVQSGNVLLAAVIAYQAGMLTFGPLDRILDTRKWIAVAGTLAITSIHTTTTTGLSSARESSLRQIDRWEETGTSAAGELISHAMRQLAA